MGLLINGHFKHATAEVMLVVGPACRLGSGLDRTAVGLRNAAHITRQCRTCGCCTGSADRLDHFRMRHFRNPSPACAAAGGGCDTPPGSAGDPCMLSQRLLSRLRRSHMLSASAGALLQHLLARRMAVSWRGVCLLLSQRQARHFFALFVLSFARLKLNKHLSVLALRSHMCSVYTDAR